jgi:hypothetical protein
MQHVKTVSLRSLPPSRSLLLMATLQTMQIECPHSCSSSIQLSFCKASIPYFLNFLQLPLADLAIPIELLFCPVVEFVCFTLFPKLSHALSSSKVCLSLTRSQGKFEISILKKLSVHLSVRPPSQGGQTSLPQYTFPKLAQQAKRSIFVFSKIMLCN